MNASMSPDELRQIMRRLGCDKQRELADRIGVHPSTVCLWLRLGNIPRHIAMLLRLLVTESLAA